MKKPLSIFLLLSLHTCNVGFAQTYRDSTYCADTSVQVTKLVPQTFDSIYSVCHTVKVPVITPTTPELHGVYVAYDAFVLGDQTSENNFLQRMKSLGVNMLNYYARAQMYTDAGRTKLAAWVKKAKENYGMVLITVDVRLTDSREYPAWVAYFQKYGGTSSMIEPLTEFEPYRLNSAGIYPYSDLFVLLQKMDALCKQYNCVLNFYEGWIGLNYSNPQAAVDSMVLHCGRIFVSNYVSMNDYLSTNTSLGVWDARMKKRINAGASDVGSITTACMKLKKVMKIVEIQSIESIFLQNLYACPVSATNKCNPFFGSIWTATIAKYNQSPADVLQWTDLVGKTIFYTALLKQ